MSHLSKKMSSTIKQLIDSRSRKNRKSHQMHSTIEESTRLIHTLGPARTILGATLSSIRVKSNNLKRKSKWRSSMNNPSAGRRTLTTYLKESTSKSLKKASPTLMTASTNLTIIFRSTPRKRGRRVIIIRGRGMSILTRYSLKTRLSTRISDMSTFKVRIWRRRWKVTIDRWEHQVLDLMGLSLECRWQIRMEAALEVNSLWIHLAYREDMIL